MTNVFTFAFSFHLFTLFLFWRRNKTKNNPFALELKKNCRSITFEKEKKATNSFFLACCNKNWNCTRHIFIQPNACDKVLFELVGGWLNRKRGRKGNLKTWKCFDLLLKKLKEDTKWGSRIDAKLSKFAPCANSLEIRF